MEPFDLLMYSFHMIAQKMFMNSFVITRGARILFGFLMYGIHVSLHIAFMAELISAQLALILAVVFFLLDAFFRFFQRQ